MRVALKLLICCLSMSIVKVAYATEDDICGTESLDSATFVSLPWIGNNQLLLDLVDSVENSCPVCRTADDGLSNTKFQVPVKAVVFYNDIYPVATDDQIQQYIREVNRIFENNGVRIHFYLVCEISRYHSINAYIDSESKKNYVLGSFLYPDAITVHFVHSRHGQAPGSALLPYKWGDKYSCYIITEGKYDDNHANSLAHELGHTLGLLHTHDKGRYSSKDNAECNKCNQESVNKSRTQEWYCLFSSGKKCEVNADGLCDTDADPKWNNAHGNVINCNSWNYFGEDSDYEKDNYGDIWGNLGNNNAMRNIMSYSLTSCRTDFTPMQRGVMYRGVMKSGLASLQNNSSRFQFNEDLDAYEPDNYWFGEGYSFMGNKIELNARQYHTFHLTNSSTNTWTACDVDWIYFQVLSNKTHIIKTWEVPGEPKPDTKIELYSVNFSTGNLSHIVTNDDISASDKFSRISRTLAPGYYAVKVTNNITDVNDSRSKGHYYLGIYDCYDKQDIYLDVPAFVCDQLETATILNVPAGPAYSVQWTADNLIISGSTIGSSVQFYRNPLSPGTGKLKATVTAASGCQNYILEKEVNTRKPVLFSSPFGISSTCDFGLETGYPIQLEAGTQATFSVTYLDAEAHGVVDVEWDFSCGNIISQQLFNTALGLRSDLRVYVHSGYCGELKARPVNSCGEKGAWKVKDVQHSTMPCTGWGLMVSPNPSQSELTYEIRANGEAAQKFSLADVPVQIVITDQMGNVKYQQQKQYSENTIDVSGLLPGIYNITAVIDGQVLNSRFTRMR